MTVPNAIRLSGFQVSRKNLDCERCGQAHKLVEGAEGKKDPASEDTYILHPYRRHSHEHCFKGAVAGRLRNGHISAFYFCADDGHLGWVIRIGVINDRSGPYMDATGEGSVVAARLAAEEFNQNINGAPMKYSSATTRTSPI